MINQAEVAASTIQTWRQQGLSDSQIREEINKLQREGWKNRYFCYLLRQALKGTKE